MEKQTNTRLINKIFSPMIVRKYQIYGWPLFVGIILDGSLTSLDDTVNKAIDSFGEINEHDIQSVRNFCGFISEFIINHYNTMWKNSVEGLAVIYYCDKLWVSSLYGDFMTHKSCKDELFSIIQTSPHV